MEKQSFDDLALRNLMGSPPLHALGPLVGLNQPTALRFHNHRYALWTVLLGVFFPALIIALVLLYLWTFGHIHLAILGNLLNSILFLFVFAASGFVMVSILLKLFSLLIDRAFVDTLCVVAVLYLVIELQRHDVLTRSDRKGVLLYRIDYLAKVTRLLAQRHASRYAANEDWIRSHFDQIELYVRERERWAFVSRGTTLDDLRRDFSWLAGFYIGGNYGDFSYESAKSRLPDEGSTGQRRWLSVLLKVLGLTVPLVLMGLYLYNSSLFPFIDLDSNTVALIFISWLLLAIDASLQLGIVSGLAGLAKGIKDLR